MTEEELKYYKMARFIEQFKMTVGPATWGNGKTFFAKTQTIQLDGWGQSSEDKNITVAIFKCISNIKEQAQEILNQIQEIENYNGT
mgnify:CR=1 FL=1